MYVYFVVLVFAGLDLVRIVCSLIGWYAIVSI